MKRNKKAFTLIELLVVVLIIGILSAVALPQYEKAVHKARFSEVPIRLRNMTQAFALYVLENGDLPRVAGHFDLSIVSPDITGGLEYAGAATYGSNYKSKHVIYTLPNCYDEDSPECGMGADYTISGSNTVSILAEGWNRSAGDWASKRCYYIGKIGKSLCSQLDGLGYDSVCDDDSGEDC